MKSRLHLLYVILIIFLSMNSIISIVNADKFSTGLRRDDHLVWICNVCKRSEMDNIFGTDWDDSGIFENISKGYKMRWEIIDSEVNGTHIKIDFSIWKWTNEAEWGILDRNSTMIYLSSPKDYSDPLNFSEFKSLVPFWFPTPVGEYMGELKLNEWYNVDNRVLPTLNVEIEKNEISPGYPTRNIKIIAIYNENGAINSYKLYIKDNVVILDISLNYIPWYVIPALIFLSVILSLGVILYVIRKRKMRVNS
ncbi:MAG: hypothetical protein ACFFD2_15510 [Promethearchaeota archaeon]